jgi:FdrA protein
MLAALDALAADAETAAIVLVSKPPAPAVAERVLARAADAGKPVVVCFLGSEVGETAENVHVAPTLEDAARQALSVRGRSGEALDAGSLGSEQLALGLDPERHLLRALYSGGTFAYEADHLLAGTLDGVEHGIPGFVPGQAVSLPERHLVLDLGGDDFTVGRPHPMIDPTIRLEFLEAAGASASTAVILLDVVIGHGAAADPVGPLLPLVEDIRSRPGAPVVVAFVVGTAGDAQDALAQERRLKEAGAVLAPSSTAAARLARDLVAAQAPERSVS